MACAGFGNPSQALSTDVDGDDLQKLEVIDGMGPKQMASHVNESSMYTLIFGSTKNEAKRFKLELRYGKIPYVVCPE